MKIQVLIVLFICFIFGNVPEVSAQKENKVEEDAVGMQVLKTHYEKYPLALTTWSRVVNLKNQELYKAKLKVNDSKMEIFYRSNGKIQVELADQGNNIPGDLLAQIDAEMNKYKVRSFTKATYFDKNKVEYLLKIQLRSEVLTKTYDKDFNPLPDRDLNMALGY
ncbi:MAG: hypothetical protein KI790_19720 [Cyclobacteriaceae bacterium]|nr:hypothetical protein [Cyclobacteriaceae bacterium HetDA_MAG_MS6]